MRKGKGPGNIIDPEISSTMVEMLESTIKIGTGKNAILKDQPAGKTGTSSH